MEYRNRETVVGGSYASGAFKISRPLKADLSGQKLLYLMNPGGGYVDGDRYRMEVALGAGAELALTTQSATKVYRTPKGRVCSDTDIRLADGALLELLPDPVIAYEDAVYFQQTTIRMEAGACLILADAWTPGWSPSGRSFRYRRIDSLTELYVGEELQLVDRLCLRPDGEMAEIGELEGYTHYGSLLVVHQKGTQEAVDELYEGLRNAVPAEGIRFGLTSLALPGFILRIMARSTEDLQRLTAICHDEVRKRWLGKPPLRIRK
ncbi:urease accessory protein UreD [Cohnella sp. CBP 2801]|uniref:Urease accessory protein UreD n=1 Tax=Cohnella zeiphila TaxID=2761120 RepID=A0A7X0SJL2_9BACL|nr:urease accessory protein UreD [Cohnella zeiphila]